MRFIAGAESPSVKDFSEKIRLYRERLNSEKAFMQARANKLQSDGDDLWNELWASLQLEGKIEKTLKRDDFAMNFNPEHLQVHIEPKGDDSGLPRWLAGMMGE